METKHFKRKIYLEDKPRKTALAELMDAFEYERGTELLPTAEALGRVTAEPIFAKTSMPHYHASAMDGVAVRAEDTYSAHEQKPLHLTKGGQFCYVDTGNAIPQGFNAVIMIENVQVINEDTIEIIEPATPWQHIRPIGEDIVQEEMLFSQGHLLRPVDLGALLASQITKVPITKKPSVAIIPTGNELVTADSTLSSGRIIEFNGTVFSAYIQEWGGHPILHSIVPDEPEKIKKALLAAADTSDIVIINAGSSAGSKDYTVHILEELGTVFTHGVATRPGKPVILGKINGTIVIGVPGYPVSAYLALEWFLKPLIYRYLQMPVPKRQTLAVTLGRRIVSTMGAEDFVRVNIGLVNGKYVANPLTRAAGVTMSLVRADGLLVVAPEELGYEQGDTVEVELLKPLEEIANSIVVSGSHDLTIDLLSSALKKQRTDMKIVSSHVGSMAGLMAIKKGEAHVAGIHLLDPATKQYNLSYVQKVLRGQDVVLLPFLKRKQGLFLHKGNPLEIKGIRDIVEKGAHFVNRQKGAGTRILFDMLLDEAGLSPEDIMGYDREMFSHLSVAAEVENDAETVGLGIYPAARSMGLEFEPIADEEYDLIMTKAFFDSEKGKHLISVIRSAAFKQEVDKIGGYILVENTEPIMLKEE